MRNLWKKSFYVKHFVNTAQNIIQEQCDYLKSSAGEKIVAKVVECNLPENFFADRKTNKLFRGEKEEQSFVQEGLGEVGENRFTYEFYITSVATPNYKYRIMFIEYGIIFYPVYIVLDESIALEIGREKHMVCQTQEEFETVLEEILNSNKLDQVINNLLVITEQQKILS